MKIQEIVETTAHDLRDYSDAPHLDADRILLHVLGQREPSYLLAHAQDNLATTQIQKITTMAEQRKTGMPLAYIIGEADFYGRTFIVTPDVLIPRPDTEALIERALEYIKHNFSEDKEITIADICTGSGIIAITLLLEIQKRFPNLVCRFIACDISPAALVVAKLNAKKHAVLEKIEFMQGDMLEPILNKHIDLIVSNPPYVPSAELSPHFAPSGASRFKLETVGLKFEPRIALDGGPDGQLFVDQIKASGIPAIIETTGGGVILSNI